MQLELSTAARLGVTVIYVTHDQEEALTLSDRIAVMIGAGSSRSGSRPSSMRRPRPVRRPVHRRVQSPRGHDGTGDGGRPVLITRRGCGSRPTRRRATVGEGPALFLRPERIAIGSDGGRGGGGDRDRRVGGGGLRREAMRYVVAPAGARPFTGQATQPGHRRSLKVGARVTLRGTRTRPSPKGEIHELDDRRYVLKMGSLTGPPAAATRAGGPWIARAHQAVVVCSWGGAYQRPSARRCSSLREGDRHQDRRASRRTTEAEGDGPERQTSSGTWSTWAT